jgi:hypothetical protein
MEVGRRAGGDSERSTARKRLLSMEWKLFRATKQGGKTTAEEIKLEPGQDSEDDQEIYSKSPRRRSLNGDCGENVGVFFHGGRCG